MTHVLRLNEESWRLLVTLPTDTGSHPPRSVSIAAPEDIFFLRPNHGAYPVCREAHQLRRRQALLAAEDRRPPAPPGYDEAAGAAGRERDVLQTWGMRPN